MSIKDQDASKNRLSLSMKCGDCSGFSRGPTIFDRKCCERGIKSYANACDKFVPDLFNLTKIDPDILSALADSFRGLSSAQQRLMAYTLKNASQVQKTGFKMFQPIYINLSAPYVDYVECYFRGRVVGICDQQLIIASHLRKTPDLLSIMVDPDDIMSRSKFVKHRKYLDRNGKIRVPEEKRDSVLRVYSYPEVAKTGTNHNVPTLNTAPAEWLTPYAQDGSKKKSNRISSNLKKTDSELTMSFKKSSL